MSCGLSLLSACVSGLLLAVVVLPPVAADKDLRCHMYTNNGTGISGLFRCIKDTPNDACFQSKDTENKRVLERACVSKATCTAFAGGLNKCKTDETNHRRWCCCTDEGCNAAPHQPGQNLWLQLVAVLSLIYCYLVLSVL